MRASPQWASPLDRLQDAHSHLVTGTPLGPRGIGPLAAVAVLVVLSACSLPETAPTPRLDGTSWVIERFGDTPTIDSARPTISFGENGLVVTVRTACATWTGRYDSTGEALLMGLERTGNRNACSDDVADQEARVIEALQSVVSWSAQSENQITLSNTEDLLLTR